MPMQFEAAPDEAGAQRFHVRAAGYALSVGPDAVRIALVRHPRHAPDLLPQPGALEAATIRSHVEIQIAGANTRARVEVGDRLPGFISDINGDDPARWRQHVPTFASVTYRSVYEGIDMALGGAAGRVRYDFIVQPGAEPSRIALRVSGVDDLRIDRSGKLLMKTAAGTLTQSAPVLFQMHGERVTTVNGAFILRADGSIGFQVGDYDRSLPLTIDPTLTFASYLGEQSGEGRSMATVADGVLIAGSVLAPNGQYQAYVTKIARDGSARLFTGYIGGCMAGSTFAQDIAIGRDQFTQRLFMTGYTTCTNFPRIPATGDMHAGLTDAFIVGLDPGTLDLAFSRLLGGSGNDWGLAIVANEYGDSEVVGQTTSSDMLMATGFGGVSDGFHTLHDRDSGYPYSMTFLGGSNADAATDITSMVRDNPYRTETFIVGHTQSDNFPGAVNSRQQLADVFLISPTTVRLFGGSGEDRAYTMSDCGGVLCVTGLTRSTNLPTVRPLQNTLGGPQDALLAAFDPDTLMPTFASYFGGNDYDLGGAIGGYTSTHLELWIAGETLSTDLTQVRPLQPARGTGWDAFLARLIVPAGAAPTLRFSSYIGGPGEEGALSMIDVDDQLLVSGWAGTAFPTTANGFDRVANGDAGFILGVFSRTVVSSIAPASGPVAGGTPVTITGVNFEPTATVFVGTPETPATNVVVVNSTTITAMTPPGSRVGPASVIVRNSPLEFGGELAGIIGSGFNYIGSPPTAASAAPAEGSTVGSTHVTVNGTNFASPHAYFRATVNGVVTRFEIGILSWTATTMVVVTPQSPMIQGARYSGPVDLEIVNIDGLSVVRSVAFTYRYPVVTSVTPGFGPIAGQTPILIRGNFIASGAEVTLSGGGVTSVTVVPPDTITALTTAGTAGIQSLTVRNTDGSSGTLQQAFVYIGPAPTASIIDPASGPTSGGTTVTIVGTNFVSGATVSFGGVNSGSVTVVSPTTLQAISPAHAAGLVNVVVTNPGGRTATMNNAFRYTGNVTTSLDRSSLQFSAVTAGSGTSFVSKSADQTIALTQTGGTAAWTATATQPWLTVTPTSGSGSRTLTVGVVPHASLPPSGAVNASISFSVPNGANAPSAVTVSLALTAQGASRPPFGVIETPANNTQGMAGAFPLTGWALDDIGINRISVCRLPFGNEAPGPNPQCGNQAEVFIGQPVFVEGARPDVAAAFPAHPNNTRAGWGLMVLSNMLPNQGNGTFTFTVYLRDIEGAELLLGARTISCDNANSILPFGAIDTPAQGGIASGNAYLNFGWALTPNPKLIPVDGSTMSVLIDGVSVGRPTYNQFRSDIATLFPSYANSQGAVGFRVIDTTTLSSGVHTISWTVVDNAGAVQGIGSRYFSVTNGAAATGAAAEASIIDPAAVDATVADSSAVVGRRGWDLAAPLTAYAVDESGRAVVRGQEVDRFELSVGQESTGYMRTAAGLAPLPIGSHLDAETGIFTWAPGAGFVGPYDLVFVRTDERGTTSRREIRMVLQPKTPGTSPTPAAPLVVPGAPFGTVDTPADNTVVAGEVPYTGWALDDSGIVAVDVYRAPVGSEVGGPLGIYIGTGTFVPGARPDVEAAFPDYPNAGRAGWGLMILSNMLPNSGNGTFQISAYARSVAGETQLLGTKTIIGANTGSARPFGTIDTPAQGATVSGQILNFGWALTPRPNAIPTDGSTIDVYIDNVFQGHPVYNNFRADIATLFPNYANSNGAVGYYMIDTLRLSNGIHTISWVVRDNAGNTQGVGSRYFTVANPEGTFVLRNASETAFNAAGAPLVVDVVDATVTDANHVTVFRNNLRVAPALIEVGGNAVTINGTLLNGRNDIVVLATDTNGKSVFGEFRLWAGSQTLTGTVVDELGQPVTASVLFELGDDKRVTAGTTTAAGAFTMSNVPNRTIFITATGSSNRLAWLTATGSVGSIALQLRGFAAPSPVANNDFGLAFAGWETGTAPVELIPHVESSTPTAPAVEGNAEADTDLRLSTQGEGPQVVSRTFASAPGTKTVSVRYRFVTSEVPGGFFGSEYNDSFTVTIRSQTAGGSHVETQSMNGLGLAAFTAAGETEWREITLPVSETGDTVEATMTVTNVADGLYDSFLVVDGIGEKRLIIRSYTLLDLDNRFDLGLTGLSADPEIPDNYQGGYTQVHGTITIEGAPADSLQVLVLDIVQGGQVVATAELAPEAQSALQQTFGSDNRVQITVPQRLFRLTRIEAAKVNRTEDSDLTLRIRARTALGEQETKEVGTVPLFVRYTHVNRYGSSRDLARGGDDWAKPSVRDIIDHFRTVDADLVWNDFSNMNAGDFRPDHASHQLGVDVDGRFTGYLSLDADAADTIIGHLNDPTHGSDIAMVFVKYRRVDTDPFWVAIRNVILDDERPARDVIIPEPHHGDHFHWRLAR